TPYISTTPAQHSILSHSLMLVPLISKPICMETHVSRQTLRSGAQTVSAQPGSSCSSISMLPLSFLTPYSLPMPRLPSNSSLKPSQI
ncbi:uncharacterized protein HMPREF1541_08517, partial [Cyphellophora europaea CBS 101466]